MQSSKPTKTTDAASDMLTALKVPEVRRVFLRIFAHSNILQASYRKDAMDTAYNEGLRAMGLYLKKEIDKADPEAFARLLTERRKEV